MKAAGRLVLTWIWFAGATAAAYPVPSAEPVAAAAFVDVTVLPMDADRALEHRTVLVRDGRIVAIEAAADFAPPAGTRRIDGRGRFLIPGLTDAHVHLYSPHELPLYLANGVTTVFNLNGRPAHLEWRRQIEAGELAGPRIVTTGPTFARSLAPEEAVREVEAQAAAGYDGVKVYVQVGAAEYPALARAVRRHRLLFTGHVARGPGFAATVAAGQSIAHAEEFLYSYFNPSGDDDTSRIVYDRSRIPAAVALTAAAGVAVTPTLSMYRDILRQATELERYLERPELRFLAPWLRSDLDPPLNRYRGRYPPDELERMKTSLSFQRELVRRLAEAGVPILAGTDATALGPVAGYAVHEELAELVVAGLSPYQALAAATVAPARYFGRLEETGTVAVGRRADLVLLAADPRADIGATRRIEGVMRGGRWLDRTALAAEVEAVPARYRADLESLVRLLGTDSGAAERFLAAGDPLEVMAGAALERVAEREGAEAVRNLVGKVRAGGGGGRVAGEEAINGLGYRLLARGRTAEAIALFETNVAEFPRSANALDSLADAWARDGREDRAIELYRRALDLDPGYGNAPFAREFLGTHRAKEPTRGEAGQRHGRGASGAKATAARAPRTMRNASILDFGAATSPAATASA